MTSTDVWTEVSEQLRRYVGRSVLDAADADDVLQDTFLKLHAGIDSLRDRDRVIPWVQRIARNAIIDHHRRVARQRASHAAVDPEQLAATTRSAEELAPSSERIAAMVREMIDTLPARYRDALVLIELEGLKQREAAQRLGLSLSGTKSRVQRGRRLLRQALLECCHFELDRRGSVLDYWPQQRECRRCNC